MVSQFGDCTIKPVSFVERVDGAFDLVILACKAYDLDSAVDIIAPAVGSESMVLPLLNGMNHIDLLKQRFGDAVLGGFCIISSTLDGDGTIRHLNDTHTLKFGELSGAVTKSHGHYSMNASPSPAPTAVRRVTPSLNPPAPDLSIALPRLPLPCCVTCNPANA